MSQESEQAKQAGEGQGDTPEVSEAAAPVADEMSILKQRAKLLGITHSNNISLETLRAKVKEKMESSQGSSSDDAEEEEAEAEQEEAQPELNPLEGDTAGKAPAKTLSKRDRIRREAMALVRCRITNLDPKKKDLPGEIFCVGNKFIGTVKKFIPYGEVTDDGYHIPKVLFDELESRKFLHIQTSKNKQNGQIQVKTSYAKEFAIEVLPMLTPEQLAKLAAAQLAASNG